MARITRKLGENVGSEAQDAKPLKRNQNHPKRGSSIKVEPIRDLKAIKRIKKLYAGNPRDLCLFTFGINTAFRAGEILSLRVGQVDYLMPGDMLEIKQTKTGKYRCVRMNQAVIDAIDAWLKVHPDPRQDVPLFLSSRGGSALTVSAVNGLIKKWCREVGLRGNYGSHSMRKTWGYHQRVQNKAPIPLLMDAFGHSSQAQTLTYLGIQDIEVQELFDMEL
ncbi:MAG: site-specific integrase [Paracoccaceae bacterium]|nr:site-specific integrase [Paracoccaceae bacterium]